MHSNLEKYENAKRYDAMNDHYSEDLPLIFEWAMDSRFFMFMGIGTRRHLQRGASK